MFLTGPTLFTESGQPTSACYRKHSIKTTSQVQPGLWLHQHPHFNSRPVGPGFPLLHSVCFSNSTLPLIMDPRICSRHRACIYFVSPGLHLACIATVSPPSCVGKISQLLTMERPLNLQKGLAFSQTLYPYISFFKL